MRPECGASACLLCGRPAFRTLGVMPARADTQVRQCDSCGLAWLDPAPGAEELAAYYAQEYARAFGAADPNNPKFVQYKARPAGNRLRYLQSARAASGARLLEIGCAEGEFLRLAQAAGFDVAGIEPDAALARRAASVTQSRVTAGVFPEGLGSDQRFDVIAAFHVIEHVRDPAAFVAACAARLEPGGCLYLATPDLADARGDVAHPMFRPCHLWYFTQGSLTELLTRAGLNDVATHRTDACGKPELKAMGRR